MSAAMARSYDSPEEAMRVRAAILALPNLGLPQFAKVEVEGKILRITCPPGRHMDVTTGLEVYKAMLSLGDFKSDHHTRAGM